MVEKTSGRTDERGEEGYHRLEHLKKGRLVKERILNSLRENTTSLGKI